jgi:antitoxin (DNA-binding transcriptional repressor) of toxin-antitoxin stability system
MLLCTLLWAHNIGLYEVNAKMKASIREMRSFTKEIMQTVARGEAVIITYRGKPYAKITRIKGENEKTSKIDNELFGIWKDHEEIQSVTDYINKLREGRKLFVTKSKDDRKK